MNQKSLDKKKTGWRKITADDLKRGIDLSKSIYGFKVIETKSNKKKTEPKSTVSFCSKCGGVTLFSEIPISKKI